jgi:cytochrome bd-type quinol oxidase subunit 2
MLIILIPLGIVVFAGVAYLAISKKSSLKVRIVALVALALMVAAVIVCLFLIFGNTSQATVVLPAGPPVDVSSNKETNFNELLIFVIMLIVLFLIVSILSLREQRLAAKKNKQTK